MKHLIILILILTTLSTKAKNKTKLKLLDTIEIVEDNVLFKVFSDDNYIYLNVSTTDKKTSMSIIRNGLTIYFDVKGKRKEDVYIKYPYNSESRQLRQNPQELNKNEGLSSIDLSTIIENIPREAEYGYYEEKQQFHKDLNSQDISLGYKATGELLEFLLKIPKDKISIENKTDFSKLSIGVITNKFERNPKKDNNQKQNQGVRKGNGNGRGGGMGSRSGQMSRGNNGKKQNPQAEQVSIDFWFDANLDKK